ncbi:MAG: hypothetical protein Kow00117_21650 [Phototrophicales bacterium]
MFFSELFFKSDKPQWIEATANVLKLIWIIPLPYAIVNFYSFARYPVFLRKKPPAIQPVAGVRLFFRIVTRGKNPNLVAASVKDAVHVLSELMDSRYWRVEVVTDSPLDIPEADVIIVPKEYTTPNGTLYKGRALHYALSASCATDSDWIIHLDEETRFDADTVRTIYAFAQQEHLRLKQEKNALPKVGQGVILYGKRRITSWITTLADSIRVGDDYGRFRLQFEHGKAYFGMHGSFIVINNGLEKRFGFDHGPESSITEDAYLALIMQQAGVEFQFLNTFMYEQSPFNIMDYIRQRRRWFGGLWLVAMAREIAWKERAILWTFMVMWSVSWLCLLMVYLNVIFPTQTPVWLAIMGGVSFLYYVTLYVIGFLRTFDYKSLGWRFFPLLLLQIILIPLFSAMESGGVVYGLLAPPRDFYVVQKEDTTIATSVS